MAKTQTQGAVWYSKGLDFTCTRCGKCCRDRDEPTFVFVEEDDILALSEHLGLSVKRFISRYCAWDEDGYILTKKPGACIFWSEEVGCEVYEARPVQCRTWPFWASNLREENWEEAADFCPGCNTGRHHGKREIEASAVRMMGRRGEGAAWPREIPFPV
jgi:hypothetical protein